VGLEDLVAAVHLLVALVTHLGLVLEAVDGVVYHYQHDGSVVAVNKSVVDLSHQHADEGDADAGATVNHHIVPVAAYRRPR